MSLVNLYGVSDGGSCGYCKDKKSPKSTWYTKISPLYVEDYKNLIDRGWRRCGSLCYKPLNKVTCCPCYTIRCKATEFALSRSQKNVLKAVSVFLNTGLNKNKTITHEDINMHSVLDTGSAEPLHLTPCTPAGDESKLTALSSPKTNTSSPTPSGDSNKSASINLKKPEQETAVRSSNPRSGSAHRRRWVALQDKMKLRSQHDGVPLDVIMQLYQKRREYRLAKNRPKQLEDYLNMVPPRGEAKHFLEVRLCRSSPRSPEFNETLVDEHNVYAAYQVAVHGDKPEDCRLPSFLRFLVQSPLIESSKEEQEAESSSGAPNFGSYHQQYWLDGVRLIAVGVVDLLPGCFSSVYLFYDPEFAFLKLGTYAALREIGFVRELHRLYGPNGITPDPRYTNFEYYYMGYYIHSCQKMRYKAQFSPSWLACPETAEWVPVDECKRILDKAKYSRFAKKSAHYNKLDVANQEVACLLPEYESIRSQLPKKKWQKIGEGIVLPLRQASKFLNPRVLSEVEEWKKLVGPVALAGQLVLDFSK